jgi:hypothetical protein
LKGLDTELSLANAKRLETFLAVYDLALGFAQSLLPYVELQDDLDSIIGQFESQGAAVLPDVERLARKRIRREAQAFASGCLALFVLLLYVLASETNLALWLWRGLVLAVLFSVIPIFLVIAIWRNFPPLLPPIERKQ